MVTYSRSIRIPPKAKREQEAICADTTADFNGNAADTVKAFFPDSFQRRHSLAPCSLWLASHALSPSVGIRIQRPILITGGDASLCTSS